MNDVPHTIESIEKTYKVMCLGKVNGLPFMLSAHRRLTLQIAASPDEDPHGAGVYELGWYYDIGKLYVHARISRYPLARKAEVIDGQYYYARIGSDGARRAVQVGLNYWQHYQECPWGGDVGVRLLSPWQPRLPNVCEGVF